MARRSDVNSADAPEVLVVDDEAGLRDVLDITLRRQGLRVTTVAGVRSALATIAKRSTPFPLIITDLVMPDGSGMDVLKAAHQRDDGTEVIVITAHSTVEAAIEAMRLGAYDFVAKPFSPAEVAALANKALEKSAIVAENKRLRARLASVAPPPPSTLFGDDPSMRRVEALVRKAATTRTTVLITGESGTGKEYTARALHRLSDRADGPFCVVNCGALPEALMESELFGHEKGAFTGASSAALGLFRQADGGTLLLDEIGELPLTLQVKLLRVLQERKVRPVGASREVAVDVRLLAATNRDVEQDVKEGTFRQDLYYRLNVIRIALPPLRQRPRDIRQLATETAARLADEFGKDTMRLTAAALKALERYRFPGNIRELENIIERAVALSSNDVIGLEDLPDAVTGAASDDGAVMSLPADGCNLDEVL
ncbi:MAG TPA: sigma-54-dependent Fis family transcriptional regulator, partial [Sorangium sp.]|nr:sigma-54-dependent Fis family transcriptional regulator [Sorangium sp.]